MVVFFFLEMGDRFAPVNQHFQCGGLYPPHVQGFVIQAGFTEPQQRFCPHAQSGGGRPGYRSHKLKPYRAAAKAEKAAQKANANYLYQKALHDNPQIAASNPFSRYMQKQRIKKQYAKTVKAQGAKSVKNAAANTRKAAKKTAEETKKAIAFVGRHPAGICIAVGALLLFIMISSALSSCGAMFSGMPNSTVIATNIFLVSTFAGIHTNQKWNG